ELINAVEKLSGDLCISRPQSRLSWGIELPFDPDYVTYVWFDALTNYISFIGYDPAAKNWEDQPEEFREKWPALHIIGKDILIPAHGIYWPIMLKALGFPDEQMPKFLVHGWWNISGAKMSKSLGNVIDPDQLADKYGAEALRYYLMSDINTGKDSDFLEDRLVSQYNSDLANSLGNLLNRSVNMLWKYRLGVLQAPADMQDYLVLDSSNNLPSNFDLVGTFRLMTQGFYRTEFDQAEVDGALVGVMNVSNAANRYVELGAPWKIAKDPARHIHLDAVLHALAESLRIIAILVSPILPKAAHGIFDQLNWEMEPELAGKEARFSLADAEWGKLPDGHVVGKPTPLFPRIEMTPDKSDIADILIE
ncbi:MAG: class I tRNA ligase family protein, partial [Chthoniobacterales bacterium]